MAVKLAISCDCSTEDRFVSGVLASIGFAIAVFAIRWTVRYRDQDSYVARLRAATPADLVLHFRRQRRVASVCFLSVAAIIAGALLTPRGLDLFYELAPKALVRVYEWGGFWPAALVLPAFWLFLFALQTAVIREKEAESTSGARPPAT